jgi:hypothetical protein
VNGVGEGFRKSEGDCLVDDLINGLIDGIVNSVVNLDCGIVLNEDRVLNPLVAVLAPAVKIDTLVVAALVVSAQDAPVAACLRRLQVVSVVGEFSRVILLGTAERVGHSVEVSAQRVYLTAFARGFVVRFADAFGLSFSLSSGYDLSGGDLS